MGQAVHVMLFADSEPRGLDAAQAVLAELRRVEARLSLFDEASDLVELNRLAGRRAMRVDADLLAVLAWSRRLARETGGAFDPAVEPLMRAWGFHLPRRSAPSARELAEAREAVRAAEIRVATGRAYLPSAHTQLDFGGIGVGYALDRAAAVLRARGIARGLVDVSGDVIATGAPPGESGWPVRIAAPASATVRLRDAALATSANAASVVRYGDLVVGHVLDPATGQPARALRQVTVVARTGVEADALATAALVRGRRPARAIAFLPV
jgi:thiamine biosynthesis lipoprotein